jgi:hypothetical protein
VALAVGEDFVTDLTKRPVPGSPARDLAFVSTSLGAAGLRQGLTNHVWTVAEVLGYRSAAP